MDWANSTLWPTLIPLFRAIMRTPEAQRDLHAIEAARLQSFTVLQVLDAHLASSKFVGGPAFTMADSAVGCAVWRWFALPVERPALSQLQRWFDTLAARNAYRTLVMLPLT